MSTPSYGWIGALPGPSTGTRAWIGAIQPQGGGGTEVTVSVAGLSLSLSTATAPGVVTKSAPGRAVTLTTALAPGVVAKSMPGVSTALTAARGSGAATDAATGQAASLALPYAPGVIAVSMLGQSASLSTVRGPGAITVSATGQATALTAARAVATKLAAASGSIVCLSVAHSSAGTIVEARPGVTVCLSLARGGGSFSVPYVWTRELEGGEAMRARAAYRIEVFDNEDLEIYGAIRSLVTLAGANLRFVGYDADGDVAWDSDATPATATADVVDSSARTYAATTTPKAAGVYKWFIEITNTGQVTDPVWGFLVSTQRNGPISQALQDQLTGADS